MQNEKTVPEGSSEPLFDPSRVSLLPGAVALQAEGRPLFGKIVARGCPSQKVVAGSCGAVLLEASPLVGWLTLIGRASPRC